MARGRPYTEIRRHTSSGAEVTQAALDRFRGRLPEARRCNEDTLRFVLGLNADTEFGRQHGFRQVLAAADPAREFRRRVALMEYADLAPHVARIQAGISRVLTTDPVEVLAGSAGTTDRPKRIPRTRRAQHQSLELISFAQRAVIHAGISGADAPRRGVNLICAASPPVTNEGSVPVVSGPGAGMAAMRDHIPLRWTSPSAAYDIPDPVAALHVHALFALRERSALYIETPFAPQLTGWFAYIQCEAHEVLRDLAAGSLRRDLAVPTAIRRQIEAQLAPMPRRARAVERQLARGLAGIIPRLWSRMAYVRTVTSGSFGLSLPRLRWLAGPEVPIQSGCHASSEGVIGLNLQTDGTPRYVLAVGSAHFEFLPVGADGPRGSDTVDLAALEQGAEYEVVLTSCAGLCRYRLGDVVRITGWEGQAPEFEFLYRRGTVLNLVGEKTSEHQTARALCATLAGWLGVDDPVRDYTVAGRVEDGEGRYTFFVELADGVPLPATSNWKPEVRLADELGVVNPYYRLHSQLPGRLGLPELRFVKTGTFDELLARHAARAAPASYSQLKIPRRVVSTEMLALLERSLVA